MKYEFTFTAKNGTVLDLTSAGVMPCLEFEGISEVSISNQSQSAPNQDGETWLSAKMDARDITLNGYIQSFDDDIIAQQKNMLIKATRPKLGAGTLRCAIGSKTYMINAQPSSIVQFKFDEGAWAYMLSFTCFDPYWYDVTTLTTALTAAYGGLEYPIEYPIIYASVNPSTSIDNEGSNTPIIAVVSGAAVNPSLVNATTGKYLKLNYTLGDGDQLEINTAFGKKTVTLYKAGGSSIGLEGYVAAGSTFWQLQEGKNEVALSSDDTSITASAALSYIQRYEGI